MSIELNFKLNQDYSFNNTTFWYKSKNIWAENRSLFPLKGERDRKKGREKSPAFPLYISQQCSTEFHLKVWTHKIALVPWKLWHHDWDMSVTSTSIWPVQQILNCFPISTVGLDSTLQIKQHEPHSVNSTWALSWQQIYD